MIIDNGQLTHQSFGGRLIDNFCFGREFGGLDNISNFRVILYVGYLFLAKAPLSVDTHGRAYLSYPSNANPTTLNTQYLGAYTWFYFIVRDVILIMSPLRGSKYRYGTFFIIISSLRDSILSDGIFYWTREKNPCNPSNPLNP